MNEDEVSRQIRQMAQFIRQEAAEKANELSISAEEEFNIEKLQLLELEKSKVRKEFERKVCHYSLQRRRCASSRVSEIMATSEERNLLSFTCTLINR